MRTVSVFLSFFLSISLVLLLFLYLSISLSLSLSLTHAHTNTHKHRRRSTPAARLRRLLKNYRSVLQKSPIKETIFCKRDDILQKRRYSAKETIFCKRDDILQKRRYCAKETIFCKRDLRLREDAPNYINARTRALSLSLSLYTHMYVYVSLSRTHIDGLLCSRQFTQTTSIFALTHTRTRQLSLSRKDSLSLSLSLSLSHTHTHTCHRRRTKFARTRQFTQNRIDSRQRSRGFGLYFATGRTVRPTIRFW